MKGIITSGGPPEKKLGMERQYWAAPMRRRMRSTQREKGKGAEQKQQINKELRKEGQRKHQRTGKVRRRAYPAESNLYGTLTNSDVLCASCDRSDLIDIHALSGSGFA